MATQDALERLAGGIAHDFDALLTTILGQADTLGDCLSPGDPRTIQVAAIRRAAERACRLTQQLRAFSRTQTLAPTDVDVNAVIDRARCTLQRVVGDGIVIRTELAPGLRAARADVEQLHQILYTLAVAARDAMPDGGTLAIATASHALTEASAAASGIGAGDYVDLAITDSGASIDSSIQPRLFEPFYEAPERTRAGLGLAVVRGVVEQSGGSVSVESPVRGSTTGSRVVVRLPAGRAPAEPASQAIAKQRAAETVLVAGDDGNVRALIGDVLKRRGYQVLMAADAWDALRIAERHEAPIDLLITTPGTSGAAIAGAVREQRPETRVLFVSASPGIDGMEPAAMLPQPFTPAALVRKVRAIVAREKP